MSTLQRIIRRIFQPIDILPLVFFRIAFGGIMLWEVWRYFHFDRIFRYYIRPEFFFSYWGFDWVQPLPGDSMIWLFHFLGVLSLLIMIGFLYRFAIVVFFFVFTYIFLLDQAQYLNHFYLICLVSFLLIFIPAHRKWSVDALLRPGLRSEIAPIWALWLLRGQMAVVYIYGGIAKINPDWLRGEPMRDWLSTRTDFPFIGHWFTEEWMIYLFSYGGLFFDLLIVPLILWRRTRWFALLLALAFHISNARLFNIGIFPWFAIASTLLFLPPHWFRFWEKLPTKEMNSPRLNLGEKALLMVMIVFFIVQILLPLRHFVIPGYASWTEEGHNLAWHMKLRDKGGSTYFFATDAEGITRQVLTENYLTARQFSQMEDNPQMMLRFAHYLASLEEYERHEIRVWSMISLNGRAAQLQVDPTANLAAQPDTLLPAEWIVPLVQPPAGEPLTPAMLISRRFDGALVFVNMTEIPFPLADLTLQAGDTTLSGEQFGLVYLAEDECAVAHLLGTDGMGLFPICNERGYFELTTEMSALMEQEIQVRFRGKEISCPDVMCIVSDQGS